MSKQVKILIVLTLFVLAVLSVLQAAGVWLWSGAFILSVCWIYYFYQQKERELQQIVRTRTWELQHTNQMLRDEIENRRKTEQSLREKTEKYRLLAEYATDIIWTTDMDLNFTYVSPSVERITGVPPEEALTLELDGIITPESLERAVEQHAAALEKEQKGESISEPIVMELEHYCRNGKTIWMEVNMSLMRDKSGAPVGICGTSRDITDRRKAEQQMLRSEKLAALGEMVAGVTHEISTPLGAGMMSAYHLQDLSEDLINLGWTENTSLDNVAKYGEKICKTAAVVVTNLERASDLLNSFKNVAVDQVVDDKRSFHLKKNIEETLHSLRPKYQHTKHRVFLDCPDDLVVKSYPGVFSQIITNLMMNALIHGLDGVEEGVIRVTVQRENNSLILSCHDNGKGIPERVVKKIYDPFFTTRRNQGGTGLGLHIVHSLVCKNLLGQITCQSSPGKGTEFIIRLPFHEPA